MANEVDKIIRDTKLPENVRVNMRGSVEGMRQSFKSFGIGLILSVVLVYLILMAQFASFIDPFIILLAVPPGIAGVILFSADHRNHAQRHVTDGCDHDDGNRGVEQHSDRRIHASATKRRHADQGSRGDWHAACACGRC